jgi:hypothetical protein
MRIIDIGVELPLNPKMKQVCELNFFLIKRYDILFRFIGSFETVIVSSIDN